MSSGKDGFRVARGKDVGDHSAAGLLGDWRAAERDTAAARSAASVAALALQAASAAEEAADETEAAIKAALDATAKQAATQAAEAAQLLTTTATGDKARASHAVEQAEGAETAARDRYHDAANKGFPRD